MFLEDGILEVVEISPFRFSINATFTAEPLEPVLRSWEERLASRFEVRFAPYNQVLQTLAGGFGSNSHGLNVVLARIEDLGGPANFTELLAAVRRAAEQSAAPMVFVLCPPSPLDLAQEAEMRLAGVHGLHYLSADSIARMYPVAEIASEQGDRLGRIPYTELYFCALGTALVRLADALSREPFKVIALDCDNTLWKGICGEDGPAAVEPDLALQRFMLGQYESGMLLALASKNNENDVLDTFAAHPAMPLQLRHFTTKRLNWEAKPANLASLGSELSLGLESFVFVDDNPKETAEVAGSMPQVLSLTLPGSNVEHFLRHLWAFDHVAVTEEDRKRNRSYTQGQEFGRELNRAENLQHFMDSLKLRVTFSRATPERLPRIAQLTQRTNQFNFSGVRRTEAELAGLECVTVDVSDRFGDYGLTGAVLFQVADAELHIDTFVLSCRVLGRGVEHAVMAHMGAEALRRGLRTVMADFVPNARNLPAEQFLKSIGTPPFRFDAAELQHTRWRPEPMLEEPSQPRTAAPAVKRPDYATIAREFNTVEQIRGAMQVAITADPALTLTEQKLAVIWAGLLGRTAIAPTDNFFDLGGHSLLMVQMVMRVREAFGVELGVDDVYSATLTLADLARKIESDPDDYSALLREIENMSDEEVTRLLNEA